MAKRRNDQRKKDRPQQQDGFAVENLSDGVGRSPSSPPQVDLASPKPLEMPPPMFSAEQVLRELHDAMEGHSFSSKEDLDAFISAFNRRSLKPSARKKASAHPKRQAQDLAYQAMDTRDPIESARLCTMAIKLDRYCVDALMHLARLSCEEGEEMIEHMQMVVEIGEQGLGGADYFAENEGHFWGLLETRPYMRARAYLAQVLTETGRNKEAIDHYEQMLTLNPNDNQGLRYPLLGLYLLTSNLEGVRRLFTEFESEGGAVFAWSLVLERFLSGDDKGAVKALKQARTCNKHVEKYLTGAKSMPDEMPSYYGFGDENEALMCADSIGEAWKQNPEAVQWLKKAK